MPSMAVMTNITVTIIKPFQIARKSIAKYKAQHNKKSTKFIFFSWTIDKGNAITKRIDNM